MNAVSCSSGGVMFIPDDLERDVRAVSYKEFVKSECAALKKRRLFGRRDSDIATLSQQAA